jgi:hypothetical protein
MWIVYLEALADERYWERTRPLPLPSNDDTGSCERNLLLKRAEVSANLPSTSTCGPAPKALPNSHQEHICATRMFLVTNPARAIFP